MNRFQKPEDTALQRHQIIAGIILESKKGNDPARISKLIDETAAIHAVSRRTLRRWLSGYAADGFEGLKPVQRNLRPNVSIPDDIVDEAILLRRELPSRSVDQIIDILESEGKVPKGFLRRSTLQTKLQKKGFSSAKMKLYSQKGIASRRFARAERNDMWQADIKYGLRLKIDGEMTQTYLVCFIDDATRFVVHGEFYANQEQRSVEDCLRKAISKEGLPLRLFYDNGKQFNNKWTKRACAILDIKPIFAAPYSPESKGKIERFNRTVDSFLAEAVLKNPSSLSELNHLFDVWLQECYHSREHGSIGKSPELAYKSSSKPLRFLPADIIADAFLHAEERVVDKSGCVNFDGKKYETDISLIGRKVEIVFDPLDKSVITVVDHELGVSIPARVLVIGEHTKRRPKLPDITRRLTPNTSRLLDAKESSYEQRQSIARRVINYGDFSGKDS